MAEQVSILIPAYAAEAFIDQTLLFARGQTYPNVRIIVSVDQCEDSTAARVARHAAEDARIQLYQQEKRLGWDGNVNFLLDRVETPFCFLFFHDDIISPFYVETLLALLEASPDALMAHCSVRYFGGHDMIAPARANVGAPSRRLMQFMLAPDRGAPLRGLMRTEKLADVRLQSGLPAGWWANEVFLLQLAGAGDNLASPEVHYLHWSARPGGLTAGWRTMESATAFAGLRRIAAGALAHVERFATSREARVAFAFAIYLWLQRLIVEVEARTQTRLFVNPSEINPAFDRREWPPSFAEFGDDIAAWAASRWCDVEADLAARGAS